MPSSHDCRLPTTTSFCRVAGVERRNSFTKPSGLNPAIVNGLPSPGGSVSRITIAVKSTWMDETTAASRYEKRTCRPRARMLPSSSGPTMTPRPLQAQSTELATESCLPSARSLSAAMHMTEELNVPRHSRSVRHTISSGRDAGCRKIASPWSSEKAGPAKKSALRPTLSLSRPPTWLTSSPSRPLIVEVDESMMAERATSPPTSCAISTGSACSAAVEVVIDRKMLA